ASPLPSSSNVVLSLETETSAPDVDSTRRVANASNEVRSSDSASTWLTARDRIFEKTSPIVMYPSPFVSASSALQSSLACARSSRLQRHGRSLEHDSRHPTVRERAGYSGFRPSEP